MSRSELTEALAAGAWVVTPNERLARECSLRFDALQRASGAVAWLAPRALSWSAWLDRLWLAALAGRAVPDPRTLISPDLAGELWRSCIGTGSPDLLNARGAAREAGWAWTLFHAWRDAGEGDPALAKSGSGEVASYLRWAGKYRAQLDALDAMDHASLPDVIAGAASAGWVPKFGRVVLHGFLDMTPQQSRLVDHLRRAGMPTDTVPPARATMSRCCRVTCADPVTEIAEALAWARMRIESDPGTRIAIVVADLDARRSDVVALAEEILCPELLTPMAPEAPRPYGISLGVPLASVPLVATALDLIAVGCGPVVAATAGTVLRSPFLPDARWHWAARAESERSWREANMHELRFDDLLSALRTRDPQLRERWRAVLRFNLDSRRPRDWARTWSDWLAALGWPGNEVLSSALWQARDAWSAVLANFASMGSVCGTLCASDALAMLRAIAGDTLFQPEAPSSPIQILGLLEAAGLQFDAAWLAGLDAEALPTPLRPNPFLPLAWQHAHGVPSANPASALARAKRLAELLSGMAPEIVASHAASIDGAPRRVSPLIESWAAVEVADLLRPGLPGIAPAGAKRAPSRRYANALTETAALVDHSDTVAPRVPEAGRVHGGAALLESQSTCPFQAFARYRLDADAWPTTAAGLSAMERGRLLHATLAAFWSEVRDQSTLAGLDEAALDAAIGRAVGAGLAKLEPARRQSLPPIVAGNEGTRLAATLRAWIAGCERNRTPFRVRDIERRLQLAIEGLALEFRVDRIDQLIPEGLAIVDYKSGLAIAPSRWFGERPEGLQVAIYALALDADDAPVRALAYAQLKTGEIGVRGMAADPDAWPGLDGPRAGDTMGPDAAPAAPEASGTSGGSWAVSLSQLRAEIGALARGVREGNAVVDPRNAEACRYCGLDALCRIRRLDDSAEQVLRDDDRDEENGISP
jgi:probable DNA repair protein